MIKLNQIDGLSESNKYDRIFAGFVFDFRNTKNTYWLSIDDFNLFLLESNKKSINERDIIKYKGIKVDKTIKKVKYIYDIHKLLIEIAGNYNGKNDNI